MRKLETIQTKQNLNKVYAVDEIGPGGANHVYSIHSFEGEKQYLEVLFQKGPRNVEGSQHGIIDSDLLEIVRDRLKSFQQGEFANDYNKNALMFLEIALYWLNKRVEDRIESGKLGTYQK